MRLNLWIFLINDRFNIFCNIIVIIDILEFFMNKKFL